jgi:hypothetical protein
MVRVSLESVGDSGVESGKEWKPDKQGFMENEATQTEAESSTMISRNEQSTSLLRMQLEQKDKNLLAKIHEVDRVTQEMRRWQQEAVDAAEETANVTASLAAANDELSAMKGGTLSGTDGKDSSSKSPKKARLEPYVSQIPVSVRHAVDQHKAIDLRSSAGRSSAGLLTSHVTSQAHGPVMTSQTHPQESVHTAGSSLSRSPFKSTSQIPRPIGEKAAKSINGTMEKKFETSTPAAAHGTSPAATAAETADAAAGAAAAAETAETEAAETTAAAERSAAVETAETAAEMSAAAADAAESAADSAQQQQKPSTDEGERDV